VIEWDKEVKQLGERLLALLCQGLGLHADKLKEMSCSEGRVMVGHYYPYCPEPEKTVGIACHTDPGLLTVLLQDQVGGLQVKLDGKWVNVKSVHGALVINIGDLLQVRYGFQTRGLCAHTYVIQQMHMNEPLIFSVLHEFYAIAFFRA